MSNADRASQILNNEAWPEAYAQVELALIDSWKASSPDEWKKREQIYDRLQALQDVRNKLETFLATGALDRTPRR